MQNTAGTQHSPRHSLTLPSPGSRLPGPPSLHFLSLLETVAALSVQGLILVEFRHFSPVSANLPLPSPGFTDFRPLADIPQKLKTIRSLTPTETISEPSQTGWPVNAPSEFFLLFILSPAALTPV